MPGLAGPHGPLAGPNKTMLLAAIAGGGATPNAVVVNGAAAFVNGVPAVFSGTMGGV